MKRKQDDCCSEFLEHPRYGRGPRHTASLACEEPLGYRSTTHTLGPTIHGTAVRADLERQTPSCVPARYYFDCPLTTTPPLTARPPVPSGRGPVPERVRHRERPECVGRKRVARIRRGSRSPGKSPREEPLAAFPSSNDRRGGPPVAVFAARNTQRSTGCLRPQVV